MRKEEYVEHLNQFCAEGGYTEEITEDKVEEVEEQVEEAIAEAEATGKPLPENIQKLMDFM